MDCVSDETRILVVDDVSSARKIVIRLLSKIGFSNFIEASDGAEALEILKTQQINFVISDWDMPNLDGLALMHHMQQTDELNQIPFMLITSAADKEEVLTAVQSGVSGYILKPFSVQTLEKTVNKLMEKAAESR